MDGSGEGRPVFTHPAEEVQGAVDPSGRWLTYASRRSGRSEVYVTEFPEGRTHTLVSADGGSSPVWNAAGGELFYRNGGEMWAVRVITDPVFRVEGSEMLFEADFRDCCDAVGGFSRTFDVDADGRAFSSLPSLPIRPRRQGRSGRPVSR